MLNWAGNDDLLIASARSLVKSILLDEWGSVWSLFMGLPALPMPKTNNPNSLGILFNNMLASYRGLAGDEGTMRNFYIAITQAKSQNGQPFTTLKQYLGGKTFADWRDDRPKTIVAITPTFDGTFTDEELRLRKVLLKFCALAWGLWDNMKTKRGLLTFSDMINHAGETINRGGVSRTFRHILVDEYQDTDPLQDSMIKALVGENTSLFAVGDPKQSIYRFRHADPSLFAKTINESAKRVELDTSFRTRNPLLQIINSLFASLWSNGLGKSPAMTGLTYPPLKAISADADRNGGTMPVFSVILAPHNQNNTADGRKNLAEELARHIYDWESKGRTIWDKKAKTLRAVQFSDFAILTPSRSIYPVLEEALERFGIKSIQDKSTDYFSRGEIYDVVCLLRAAADMSDDFAVAGWLMSPFSGVEEADAVKYLDELVDALMKI